MGVIHVLTGPDHLSALATLSSNTSSFIAFWYGVRWGIGHSIGLLIVGSILIAITSNEDNDGDDDAFETPETLENILEYFVGVFMLLFGAYHLRIAFLEKENNSIGEVAETNDEEGESLPYASMEEDPTAKTENHLHHHHHCGEEVTACLVSTLCPLPMCKSVFYRCTENGCSKGILSLCVGIVHGVAGPGGVLGVLPAVQLHNWMLASVYLGTFCITSTFIMGLFAALYGNCSTMLVSSDKAKFEFRTAVFSSSLSIIVGVLWIVLLSIGKLHDIFP